MQGNATRSHHKPSIGIDRTSKLQGFSERPLEVLQCVHPMPELCPQRPPGNIHILFDEWQAIAKPTIYVQRHRAVAYLADRLAADRDTMILQAVEVSLGKPQPPDEGPAVVGVVFECLDNVVIHHGAPGV